MPDMRPTPAECLVLLRQHTIGGVDTAHGEGYLIAIRPGAGNAAGSKD